MRGRSYRRNQSARTIVLANGPWGRAQGPAIYLLGDNSLVAQVVAHYPNKLQLVLGCQPVDGRIQHRPELDLVHGDERLVVHVGEETHDELAVHAVRHAAVAGNGVAKVLDLEAALEAGGEETTKGSDERGKCCQDQSVQLYRGEGDGQVRVGREEIVPR